MPPHSADDDSADPAAAQRAFEALRPQARIVYGADATAYNLGRPDYPYQVYDLLHQQCGLAPQCRVLEIGPGTGQVTRHLLETTTHVTAVEPDPGFVAYLATAFPNLQVIAAPFEATDLPAASQDLIVAATAFHWLDQPRALNLVHRILRPGGWFAMWWTIFSDPFRPDPLIDAATDRLGFEPGNQRRGAGFQLDQVDRINDLTQHGGLVDVQAQRITWSLAMTSAQVRALYASRSASAGSPKPNKPTSSTPSLLSSTRTSVAATAARYLPLSTPDDAQTNQPSGQESQTPCSCTEWDGARRICLRAAQGRVQLQARSLCVHGDTPQALDLAEAIHAELSANGIALAPFAP